MFKYINHSHYDNDELRHKFRHVEQTRFVCPKGRCERRVLGLKYRLARDIADLPPAAEAIPLPAIDGREAGFDVPAIEGLQI